MPEVGKRDKITRIEKGDGPYKPLDVRELCRIYRVSAEETEELVSLARAIHEGGSFEENTDLIPPVFGTFVDLEMLANRLLMYQPDAMPGLFQLPDYARAVFEAQRPLLGDERVERCVSIRLDRQKAVLYGPANVQIRAVLNETVLTRQVGGPKVAAAQMMHLRDLCKTSRVDVRVLTLSSGAHAAMRGSFTVLRFNDADEPDSVYVESAWAAQILNKPDQVQTFQQIFDALTEQSIPIGEFAP